MGVYMNMSGGVKHDAVGLGVMDGVASKPAEAVKAPTVVSHSEVPQIAPAAADTKTVPAETKQGEMPAAPVPDAKH